MSAFWDKFKKDDKKEVLTDKSVVSQSTPKKEKPKKEKKEEEKESIKDNSKKKKKSKKAKIENYKEKAQLVNQVIIKPIISEDATKKEAQAKYVFEVSKQATKKQISQAIETKYGVNVTGVNVINYKPKSHRFRHKTGKKKGFKKAIVTIESGQKIELFSE